MTKKKDPKDYEKVGCPTKYTPELSNYICELISTHPFGLPRIIEMYKLPDRQTIYNWLNKYPEFFDKYMHAKELQAHLLFDESLEISNQIPTYHDKDGHQKIDSGMVGRAKLQFDTIRWVVPLIAPRYRIDQIKDLPNPELTEDIKKRQRELDERNKKDY